MSVQGSVSGLRSWARGVYAVEAAVELLARYARGRFARPGWPWVVTDASRGGSGYWLDADALAPVELAGFSGGERRLLALVGSLASGAPVDLSEALPGLDRASVALVLAAIAHAAGTHEHRGDLSIDPATGGLVWGPVLGSLYPWPTETATTAAAAAVVRGGER